MPKSRSCKFGPVKPIDGPRFVSHGKPVELASGASVQEIRENLRKGRKVTVKPKENKGE